MNRKKRIFFHALLLIMAVSIFAVADIASLSAQVEDLSEATFYVQ